VLDRRTDRTAVSNSVVLPTSAKKIVIVLHGNMRFCHVITATSTSWNSCAGVRERISAVEIAADSGSSPLLLSVNDD